MSILVKKKNDQVFQLSLTELAFTLVFLLLLLSGWMVSSEKHRADSLELAIAESKKIVEICQSESVDALEKRRENAKKIIDNIKSETELSEAIKLNAEKVISQLSGTLEKQVKNPDEVISSLRKCAENDQKVAQLQENIVDLEAQITALTEIKKIIDTSSGESKSDSAKLQIQSAIVLKAALEKETNSIILPGQEAEVAKQLAVARNQAAGSVKEATNLRGQLAFVMKQIDMSKNPKGFGLPPCWVDEVGKTQKLLVVDVGDAGLSIRSGWPQERNEDAAKTPGVEQLVGVGEAMSVSQFRLGAEQILQWSRQQDPECRHYASISVSATRVDLSVHGKNAVYDYFYPYGKESLTKQ